MDLMRLFKSGLSIPPLVWVSCFGLAAVLVWAFAVVPPVERKTIQVATSGFDERIRAELQVGTGGVAVSTSYVVQVFLDPAGAGQDVFRAEKAKSFSMAWAGDGALDLCFEDARVQAFRNFAAKSINGSVKNVHIRLDLSSACDWTLYKYAPVPAAADAGRRSSGLE